MSRSARPVGSGVAGWRLHARRRPAKGRWSMGSSQSSVKSALGRDWAVSLGYPALAPVGWRPAWDRRYGRSRSRSRGRRRSMAAVPAFVACVLGHLRPMRPHHGQGWRDGRTGSTKQPLTSVNCHSWSRPMPQCSLLTYQICSSMPSQVFKIRL